MFNNMEATMDKTLVKDIMTAHPELISPDATLQEAAKLMENTNCGILPVGDENELEGVITDRDIAIRAVGAGTDPSTAKVREFMSKDAFWCKESHNLIEATDEMQKHSCGRLIVMNDSNAVTGIVTLGCILRNKANSKDIVMIMQHAGQNYA